MKGKAFVVIRVLLAAALLIYLFHSIGLEQINIALTSLQPFYFTVLFGLFLFDAILRSVNWGTLLEVNGHKVPFWELLYNNMVGKFWGTFIPSSLGTDVSRAFLIARRNNINAKDSALAMLVLNLLGLLALCLMTFVSALLLLNILEEPALPLFMLAVCVGYICFFPFLMNGWLPNRERWGLNRFGKITDKIWEFSQALRKFRNNKRTLGRVLSISLANQIMGILTVYAVSLALHLDVPFIYFVTFVPVITLSRIVPLSIAGLGAEQGIFVFLFSQVGVPPAEAFLISLILSFMGISFALIGGGLYTSENFYHLLRREH